jgi:hypothetical protein
VRSSRVGCIAEAHALGEAERVDVGLPAGRTPGQRPFAEDLGVAVAGERHLALRPRLVGLGDAILPADVIPGVHAALEARIAGLQHRAASAHADVGPGQQRAVEQRAQPVVLEHRGARHLSHESAPEHPTQGAAGVVGPEAEQEGGARLLATQQFDQSRHALEGAAKGVDVDLER